MFEFTLLCNCFRDAETVRKWGEGIRLEVGFLEKYVKDT